MSHTISVWYDKMTKVPDVTFEGDITFISGSTDNFHQFKVNNRLIILPLSVTVSVEQTKKGDT